MTYLISVMFICYLVLTALSVMASHKQCARFEFPSIPDGILREDEGTLVNFTFLLNISTSGCQSLSEIVIDRYFSPMCKIRLDSNPCHTPQLISMCGCTTEKDTFWFSKVLGTSDNCTWKWRAFDEQLHALAVEHLAFIINVVDAEVTEQHSSSNSSNGVMVTAVSGTAIVIFINAVIVGVIISIKRTKLNCCVKRIRCPAFTRSIQSYAEDTNNGDMHKNEDLSETQISVTIPDPVIAESCEEQPKVTFYQDGSDLKILICVKGYQPYPNTINPTAKNDYLTPCPLGTDWENEHNYEKI